MIEENKLKLKDMYAKAKAIGEAINKSSRGEFSILGAIKEISGVPRAIGADIYKELTQVTKPFE